VTVHAQQETIPERLSRLGRSISSGPSIPSGLGPTLDHILADTDTIVMGVVGEPRSYLSDDQMAVYTDYQLRNPAFLYQAALTGSTKPELPTVTVTILGGTITMNGLSYTRKDEALPSLEPGTEGLFLLKRVGNRYHIAGTYYGAFRIAEGRLTPLTKAQGFAPELQGGLVTQAAASMVARATALHTTKR